MSNRALRKGQWLGGNRSVTVPKFAADPKCASSYRERTSEFRGRSEYAATGQAKCRRILPATSEKVLRRPMARAPRQHSATKTNRRSDSRPNKITHGKYLIKSRGSIVIRVLFRGVPGKCYVIGAGD